MDKSAVRVVAIALGIFVALFFLSAVLVWNSDYWDCECYKPQLDEFGTAMAPIAAFLSIFTSAVALGTLVIQSKQLKEQSEQLRGQARQFEMAGAEFVVSNATNFLHNQLAHITTRMREKDLAFEENAIKNQTLSAKRIPRSARDWFVGHHEILNRYQLDEKDGDIQDFVLFYTEMNEIVLSVSSLVRIFRAAERQLDSAPDAFSREIQLSTLSLILVSNLGVEFQNLSLIIREKRHEVWFTRLERKAIVQGASDVQIVNDQLTLCGQFFLEYGVLSDKFRSEKLD